MAKKGALEHPKTLTLADTLSIMDCFALGILEAFWHHVADYFEDGNVTALKPTVFARSIRYQGNAAELWEALIDAGFIDQLEDGRLLVHDWPEHCNDYIHSKFFKAIKPFADGTRPKAVSVGKDEKERLLALWEKHEQEILNLKNSKQSENNSETVLEQSENCLPYQALPSHTIPSQDLKGGSTQLGDSDSATASAPPRVPTPTAMQVCEYMTQIIGKGHEALISRSAERFCAHHKGKGWHKLHDWRDPAKIWIQDDLEKQDPGSNSKTGGQRKPRETLEEATARRMAEALAQ